jgi:hypothetical protein
LATGANSGKIGGLRLVHARVLGRRTAEAISVTISARFFLRGRVNATTKRSRELVNEVRTRSSGHGGYIPVNRLVTNDTTTVENPTPARTAAPITNARRIAASVNG